MDQEKEIDCIDAFLRSRVRQVERQALQVLNVLIRQPSHLEVEGWRPSLETPVYNRRDPVIVRIFYGINHDLRRYFESRLERRSLSTSGN